MLWFLRGLELLQNALIFIREHVCYIAFLVCNYGVEHVFFSGFSETKRPVAVVGETRIQVEGKVLFHVGKRGL